MEINKQNLVQFRKDFDSAIKALEEKYELDISLGNIGYRENSFSAKLTAYKKGLDKAEWNWYCDQYGFKPEDFGKTFFYSHKRYTIIGIMRGSKYPILAKREDGKEFNFTPEAIKSNL